MHSLRRTETLCNQCRRFDVVTAVGREEEKGTWLLFVQGVMVRMSWICYVMKTVAALQDLQLHLFF